LLPREMFRGKGEEKIKTHFLCSVTFFRKSYRLWDIWKYIKESARPQAALQGIIHAQTHPQTHPQTHLMWHNYCFSKATMAIRMRLNFTFICTLLLLPHYLFVGNYIFKIYWFSSACKMLDSYIILLQKYCINSTYSFSISSILWAYIILKKDT
jgi:hypothetical protein